MAARLASLISTQVLNRLIGESTFNSQYRLLEASLGPETKPDYEK